MTDKNNLGGWEKHTKGIGLKLLQKFGFTGRLGKEESGVSRAVEVLVRPSNQGLGFGDGAEASLLHVNKRIEAEWRLGADFKEDEFLAEVPEETFGKRKADNRKTKKTAIELMADSFSWKKGFEADETLQGVIDEADGIKQVCICLCTYSFSLVVGPSGLLSQL